MTTKEKMAVIDELNSIYEEISQMMENSYLNMIKTGSPECDIVAASLSTACNVIYRRITELKGGSIDD